MLGRTVPHYPLIKKNCVFAFIDLVGFSKLVKEIDLDNSIIRDINHEINRNMQPRYNQIFASDSLFIWTELLGDETQKKKICNEFVDHVLNKKNRLFQKGILVRGILNIGDLLVSSGNQNSFPNVNFFGKDLIHTIEFEKKVSDPTVFITKNLFNLLENQTRFKEKSIEDNVFYYEEYACKDLYLFYQNYFKLLEQNQWLSYRINLLTQNNFEELDSNQDSEVETLTKQQETEQIRKVKKMFDDKRILNKHRFIIKSWSRPKEHLISMILSSQSSEFLRTVTEPVMNKIFKES